MGINVFSSISLSSTFPFNYLYSDTIESPAQGVLLSENFDGKLPWNSFSTLWMNEKGTVIKRYPVNGLNQSRCLLVENTGSGSWVYAHKKKVGVKAGDIFYMQGDVKLSGEEIHAYLSVSAYDGNKKVVSWNYSRTGTGKKGNWIRLKSQINISGQNIRYIRFRLVGLGIGETRFDNLTLRKINSH